MRNSARIKFGLLSATIISGATLATPGFAQDAGSDEDLDRVFAEIDHLDFLVHSIAFADKDWLADGKFTATKIVAKKK